MSLGAHGLCPVRLDVGDVLVDPLLSESLDVAVLVSQRGVNEIYNGIALDGETNSE